MQQTRGGRGEKGGGAGAGAEGQKRAERSSIEAPWDSMLNAGFARPRPPPRRPAIACVPLLPGDDGYPLQPSAPGPGSAAGAAGARAGAGADASASPGGGGSVAAAAAAAAERDQEGALLAQQGRRPDVGCCSLTSASHCATWQSAKGEAARQLHWADGQGGRGDRQVVGQVQGEREREPISLLLDGQQLFGTPHCGRGAGNGGDNRRKAVGGGGCSGVGCGEARSSPASSVLPHSASPTSAMLPHGSPGAGLPRGSRCGSFSSGCPPSALSMTEWDVESLAADEIEVRMPFPVAQLWYLAWKG